MGYTATHDTLSEIAALVHQERPEWETVLIRLVLEAHASTVAGTDLAIAALRAAQNRDLPKPAAIGWRGPHWSGLATLPVEHRAGPRCLVCGKREPDCWSQRPGIDDDHTFTPTRTPAGAR